MPSVIEKLRVDFLSQVRDRWGELCRTPERASRAADDFLPVVRLSWSPEHRGYFRGTTACLSVTGNYAAYFRGRARTGQ